MLPALLLPLLAFATTTLASPTKRDLMTDKGFVSVGHEGTCYPDSVHERVFKGAYEASHEGMSWHRCANFCYSKGFKTFGVEYGSECFCGDKHDLEHLTPIESVHKCNMPCTGDKTKKCGGSNALLVFHTEMHPPPAYPPLPPKGSSPAHGFVTDGKCYKDSVHERLIRGYSFSSDRMTHNLCIDACRDRGYNTAGVEYGRECYCSFDEVPEHAPKNEGACTFKCAGNEHQNCGGHSAIVVFERHAPMNNYPTEVTGKHPWFDVKKCFKDSQHERLLTDLWASDNMSHQACVDHCNSKGKDLAGLEYGRECWCGIKEHVKAKNPQYANNCDMGCSAKNGQRCGGSDALTILTKGSTW